MAQRLARGVHALGDVAEAAEDARELAPARERKAGGRLLNDSTLNEGNANEAAA